MKIIAVFMIVCLTFLSSLLGIANAMQPIKDNCCYNNNQSKSCSIKTLPQMIVIIAVAM